MANMVANNPLKLVNPVIYKGSRNSILPQFYRVTHHPQVRDKNARIFVAHRDLDTSMMKALKKYADEAVIPGTNVKEIERQGVCLAC